MSNTIFNESLARKVPVSETSTIQELGERLTKLKNSRERLYQLANLETWAIVGTMEDFVPGFWSRFMANRQLAFKELLEQNKVKRR